MSQASPVITIDGPSGSGKGTVCHRIAKTLGWHFLDSGALYRVLAIAALNHAFDLKNEAGLVVLAEHLDVQFQVETAEETSPIIILEGNDVTEDIRAEDCGDAASKIAALPRVREALLARQRAFRDWPGLVADGRDMGSVVFVDAQLKIYLTASRQERAQRRYRQLRAKGINVNIDQLLDDIIERDERDMSRAVAPLKPAVDSLVLDTTGMSIQKVLSRIILEVSKRFAFQLDFV